MTIKELSRSEHDIYYKRYIDKLGPKIKLIEGFEVGKGNVTQFFESFPTEKLDFRYATDKWTPKEVLQHLIDTERIFMYRCFRIARNDKAELAGFDQNVYIEPFLANSKSMNELLDEFVTARDSSISFLNSLTDNDLKNIGNANGGKMSARAAAFTIIGHEIWHMEILTERYL